MSLATLDDCHYQLLHLQARACHVVDEGKVLEEFPGLFAHKVSAPQSVKLSSATHLISY